MPPDYLGQNIFRAVHALLMLKFPGVADITDDMDQYAVAEILRIHADMAFHEAAMWLEIDQQLIDTGVLHE